MSDDQDQADRVTAVVIKVGDLATGGVLSTFATIAGALGIETAAQRCARAVAEDRLEWMEERIGDLEKGFEKLRSDHPESGARATDVRPIVDALAKALATTADPSKRKLLEHAARHAFDPAMHRQGLTVSLLEKMERLNYGDVALLRELSLRGKGEATDLVGPPGGFKHTHAAILLREDLVHASHGPGTPQWASLSSMWVEATRLGREFINLMWDNSLGS